MICFSFAVWIKTDQEILSCTVAKDKLLYLKIRARGSQCFLPQMNNLHPYQLKKIQILGTVFELLAEQHCQFSLFIIKMGNRLNWRCCLTGSFKTAPRILISSIAIGADYSFEVKNIKIWGPKFFKHNNLSVATVCNKTFILQGPR